MASGLVCRWLGYVFVFVSLAPQIQPTLVSGNTESPISSLPARERRRSTLALVTTDSPIGSLRVGDRFDSILAGAVEKRQESQHIGRS